MDTFIGLKRTIALWEKRLNVQCGRWNLALQLVNGMPTTPIMVEILSQIAKEEIEKLTNYARGKQAGVFNATWRPGLPI